MPIFYGDLNTDPLTKEEKTWCKKVENLLKKTPDRFGLATVGDPQIMVFDREKCEELEIEQEECNPSYHGLSLAAIISSEHIQGWCG